MCQGISHKAIFLKEVFDYLNKNCQYAVLRNYENLPQSASRDIDIIIKRSHLRKAISDLNAIAERLDLRLIQVYEGSEMHTFVWADIHSLEIISFDFLFSIYVRSLIVLSADEALKHVSFNSKVYHVNTALEFFAKWVYNCILNEPYPKKYAKVKEQALTTYRKELDEIIQNSVGMNFEELEKQNIRKCLTAYCWKHSSFTQMAAFYRYFVATLLNIFHPQGISIGFTGPDGSGKTTVINSLIEVLHPNYKMVYLYHFRPMLFGNLGDVVQSAGLIKEVDKRYDIPHRGGKTSPISSLCRLLYYAMDYICGYLVRVCKQMFRRGIVVFDRYYTDIICDSRRSRIYLSPRFLYYFGKLFIPSLDYNILLTASTETILKRKNELDREGIEAINSKIDYLSDKQGYYKVLNESTPEEAVSKILNIVLERQHRKNLKRLR
jgi:thymidylate kinase